MSNRLSTEQWRAFEAGEKSLADIDRENAQKQSAKSTPSSAAASGGYQRVGDVLEAHIAGECKLLERLDLARVFKVPNPVRIEKHYPGSNQVRARLEEARWVDFAGLIAGGRSVAIEAKAVDLGGDNSDRLLFSKIRGQQRDTLERVAALDGIALVYAGQVRGSVVESRFLVPVDADGRLAGMTRPGSFIFDDHPQYRLRRGQHWLDKVRELGLD